KYTASTVPDFYDLFAETILEFKKQGGIVTVVSHSERSRIERDYSIHCGFVPDAIFGWELLEHQRKPHPYPIEKILERFNLHETEASMVNDLKTQSKIDKRSNVNSEATESCASIHETKEHLRAKSTQ